MSAHPCDRTTSQTEVGLVNASVTPTPVHGPGGTLQSKSLAHKGEAHCGLLDPEAKCFFFVEQKHFVMSVQTEELRDYFGPLASVWGLCLHPLHHIPEKLTLPDLPRPPENHSLPAGPQ